MASKTLGDGASAPGKSKRELRLALVGSTDAVADLALAEPRQRRAGARHHQVADAVRRRWSGETAQRPAPIFTPRPDGLDSPGTIIAARRWSSQRPVGRASPDREATNCGEHLRKDTTARDFHRRGSCQSPYRACSWLSPPGRCRSLYRSDRYRRRAGLPASAMKILTPRSTRRATSSSAAQWRTENTPGSGLDAAKRLITNPCGQVAPRPPAGVAPAPVGPHGAPPAGINPHGLGPGEPDMRPCLHLWPLRPAGGPGSPGS